MTTELTTVNSNDIVYTVAKIFKEHSFHHVVVVNDEGDLVGVVSNTDMDRFKSGATLFSNPKKEEYDIAMLRTVRVCDIMTDDVVVLKATDPIRAAYDILKENKFRAIPIVKNGGLAGIVTPLDLLNYFFK